MSTGTTIQSVGSSTDDYTPARRLVSTTTQEYTYLYIGGSLRQMKLDTTVEVNGSRSTTTDTLYFSYDVNGVPLTLTQNGTKYNFVTNLQGDVVGLVNGSGTRVVSYTYDAWGNLLTTTGDMASSLGEVNPIRYRGYYYDTESSYYYLQSRYYNPDVGRFVNADDTSTLSVTPTELTDKNLFAYCDNNPVSRKDDGGQFWNIVIGAVVGGLISGATAAMDSISKTGSVDWTAVAISSVVGAVSGGVAATGLGVMAQATITAAASGIGSVLTDVHSRNQDLNAGKITLREIGTIATRAVANAAVGFASSVLGSAAGKVVSGSLEKSGADTLFRGKIGAGCLSKAQAKAMVKHGTSIINTARGISSVVGTLFTWPTATAIAINL